MENQEYGAEWAPELAASIDELKEELLHLREALESERAKSLFLLEAIESLPNPIFIKDEQAGFTYFNKKYEEAFGMLREDFIGKSVMSLDYLPREDRERYDREDRELIETASILHYEVDFAFADGGVHPSFYWSKGFSVAQTGQKGLIGEIVDISKEKALEQELKLSLERLQNANQAIERAAKLDPLTGLYNRQVFNTQAEALLAGAVHCSQSVCFLMADLDYFKNVNDAFGHLIGDEVLTQFARILSRSCREADIPIRYGGEEFLLLLSDVDLAQAWDIAERIRLITAHELCLPNGSHVTVSTRYRCGESLNQCLLRADDALYKAKKQGRNQVVILEPAE